MRKETTMPAETLLALEESEHLIRQLTILTERGRITWRCTDYNPLDLMPDLQEGKPETSFLDKKLSALVDQVWTILKQAEEAHDAGAAMI